MLNFIKDKEKTLGALTLIKFLFAITLTLLTYKTTKEPTYIFVGVMELALIFVIYSLLVETKLIFRLLADLLFFIYVAQMLVLFFGNSFTTLTMLKNLKFLQDLGGKLVPYAFGTILVLVVVFMPGRDLLKNAKRRSLLVVVMAFLFAEVFVNGQYRRFSPIQSFGTIFASEIRYQYAKKAAVDPQLALSTYYRESFEDGVAKPADLPKQPNIIVIFTEGLSYNIVSDEREVMPSLKKFENECITFKNYYNHTFPTLRGVQGQLYSGYKLDDDALGNNLISMQDILKDQGYYTAFINVEPNNYEFNKYCADLGFTQVITDTENVSGYIKSMTDGQAYRLLMDSAYGLHETDAPFFISMYTFGTHVSFDSEYNQFEDGSDAELNKFHNLDVEFGEFLEEFKNSELAKDTIIIFTTDHATYADQDFTNAFPDHKRDCTDVDTIPFFIYYQGVKPQEIDVKGRNSLCLTPTVLDYLDINSENYFLGTSLFDENAGTQFDTVFYDASYLISTKDSKVRYLDDLEVDEFLSQVLAYYTAVETERAN